MIHDHLLAEFKKTRFSKIIDKTFWYLADNGAIGVLATRDQTVAEIDIVSAYSTIVHLVAPESSLAKELVEIEDKRKRNILIALRCRELLPMFSRICVMTILLYISKLRSPPLLLELKRDGVLLFCDRVALASLPDSFIGFSFRIKPLSFYFRAYKTTTVFDGNLVVRKGMYKHIPKGIEERVQYLLRYREPPDLSILDEVYSRDFFEACCLKNQLDELKYWYDCEGKILLKNGKYAPFAEFLRSEVNPRLYLRLFISPILIFYLSR